MNQPLASAPDTEAPQPANTDLDKSGVPEISPAQRDQLLLAHLNETRGPLIELLEKASPNAQRVALGALSEIASAAGGVTLPARDLEAISTAALLAYRSDPLHGMHMGHKAPIEISVKIESSPGNEWKLETSKGFGTLYVDRKQKTSCRPPCYYGYVPRTCCHDEVTRLFLDRFPNSPKGTYVGDADHLDVMIIANSTEDANNTMMTGRPIGIIHGLDPKGEQLEVDPKIICVPAHESAFDKVKTLVDLEKVRPGVIEQEIVHFLNHYKTSPQNSGYKVIRGSEQSEGVEAAQEMITVSHTDWKMPTLETWESFVALSGCLVVGLRG